MPYRIYIDTEYAYTGMFEEERFPKQEDQKEIIQIAALLWDTNAHTEVSHRQYITTPSSIATLPPFFIALTGITQMQVDELGIPFPKALADLHAYAQGYDIWTFNNDYHVFEQNCAMHNLPMPFSTPFTRVKKFLPTWNIDPTAYSSGTLYQAAGLDITGHVHNALHDVRSMAAAVDYFESQSNI